MKQEVSSERNDQSAKFTYPFEPCNIKQFYTFTLHINQAVILKLFHHPDNTFG